MAITIDKNIDSIFPAYNRNEVVLDSTNKTETNFKYVVDIEVISNDFLTSTQVNRLFINPQPVNGRGRVEVNNILKDYISKELNYDVLDFGNGDQFLDFTLKFGESYTTEWVANDFIFIANRIGLTTDSGLVAGGSDIPHGYSVGDLIYVDSPDEDYVISGYWRVTDVTSTTTIQINQIYIQNGPAMNIPTRYADNRPTIFPDLEEIDRTIFNGAIQFDEWSEYDENYLIDSNGKPLITNLNNTDSDFVIPVYEDDFFTANYFSNTTPNQIEVEVIGGSTFTENLNEQKGTIGLGPVNLNNIVGLTLSVGDEYRVRLVNNNTNGTLWYYFKVVEYCSKFDNNKIIWLDRMGGWKSFNFNLHTIENINVNKTNFKRENIGTFNINTNEVEVNTEKFGEKVEHSKFNRRYNIFSDRLTQQQIYMVEDLFTSRFVYLFNGVDLTPIIIEDNNYELSDLIYRRRKTLNITYRESNKQFNN